MLGEGVQRCHTGCPLLSRQIGRMVLAHAMLVGDGAAALHDGLADSRLQRQPTRHRCLEVWPNAEHEGAVDAAALCIDMREMRVGMAALALRGKGVAPKGKPAGDLLVKLKVRLPDARGHDELQDAIAALEALYTEDVRADLRGRVGAA